MRNIDTVEARFREAFEDDTVLSAEQLPELILELAGLGSARAFPAR